MKWYLVIEDAVMGRQAYPISHDRQQALEARACARESWNRKENVLAYGGSASRFGPVIHDPDNVFAIEVLSFDELLDDAA